LSVLGNILDSDSFKNVNGYMKIGIYNHKTIDKILIYMLPEILIISLCALNEIHLRLIGMYYNTELDLESIQDGIQRNIFKGDEQKVKEKKKESANMIMANLFIPIEEQRQIQKEIKEEEEE
jgi:hypothetical protein